jgi:hypothetical protein
MRIRTIAVTLLFLSINISEAHVRESKEQCALRYGNPTKIIDKKTYEYRKGIFNIKVDYSYDYCLLVHYTKSKNPDSDKFDAISPEEMEIIRNSNSRNIPWIEDNDSEIVKSSAPKGMTMLAWKTSDGRLSAIYCIEFKTLSIIDTARMKVEANDTKNN